MTADWQHGIPLERLRAIRAIFDEHDAGLILGAFTKVKENAIAAAMNESRLWDGGGYVFIMRRLMRESRVADFTGEVRCVLPTDTLRIDRFAYRPGHADSLGRALAVNAPLAVECFVEHGNDRALMDRLGLRLAAVKVRASSELIGVWVSEDIPILSEPDRHELLGLEPLLWTADLDLLDEAQTEVGAVEPAFVSHYSGYNKRGTWSALALRGFGGKADFIIKPAEMSRGWQQQNPDTLDWPCEDTPLRDALPACWQIAESIPGPKQRVRLMRLAAGKGELSRHADTTDRESGIAEGRVARIHVPLSTNPEVRFSTWSQFGSRFTKHLPVGTGWYLDTRKPHAATNRGSTDRVHLVVDVHATPELRSLLG